MILIYFYYNFPHFVPKLEIVAKYKPKDKKKIVCYIIFEIIFEVIKDKNDNQTKRKTIDKIEKLPLRCTNYMTFSIKKRCNSF